LRLACVNSAAAPLFEPAGADGRRLGYEPAVGALLAETLGWDLAWVYVPWAEMLPSLDDGRSDAVLCGQSIIPTRQAVADFTEPYAVFHESVLVRAGDPVTSPEGLRGKRVAAIAASTNMALAETFDEAVTVPFGGSPTTCSATCWPRCGPATWTRWWTTTSCSSPWQARPSSTSRSP
jgi:polar amino acid transport system substrate-binding protein